MKRFMTYARNHKGITLVLMAILLTVLIVFAALAIDIAFMYSEKNQLQVAADAAALAGAAVLTDPNDLIQAAARAEAISFAAENRTTGGGGLVQLITDNTNSDPISSSTNDITVGHWDGTQYTPGVTPVNAVEVVPKRAEGLSGARGPIRTFLGKTFSFFGADWSFMSAKARAVATRPLRASAFVAVGNEFCPLAGNPVCLDGTGSIDPAICNLVTPRELFAEPDPVPFSEKMGWTSLLNRPGSTREFEDLMCGSVPDVDICPPVPGIWGIPGTSTATFKDYESLMCDPSYDSAGKDIDPSTGRITGWEVIIPIVNRQDPMSAPDPNLVWGYAKVHILEVCAPGSPGCRGSGSCQSHGYCTGGDKKIVVDRITCISCGNTSLGRKPALVR